jgi:hypothetical protein
LITISSALGDGWLATSEQIDRLIGEALEIIPSFTPRWGSFCSMPQMGYNARNPGEWQREVLEAVDGRYLTAFKPDTNDILTLVELVNYWTLVHSPSPTFPWHDGTDRLMPASTLATILGYALFEKLVRSFCSGRPGGIGLKMLLERFESRSICPDLAKDLKSLNCKMTYQRSGKSFDLYRRLDFGRNLLLHGRVLRTSEGEGSLLVLLIDLIVLHVMRQQMSNHMPNT